MSKIKICGLQREKDIDFVNTLKPDFIGFILTDGFRRSITKEKAKKLKSLLRKDIKAVGVFVDDDAEKINSFIDDGIIDLVQLHGNESAEFCKKINAPVIKYFKCEDATKEKIKGYDTPFFLFDSGTGTGKTFDWDLIPKTEKPFFLAGGISPENIKLATEKINPFCIDVSSSVETNGQKDFDKIKRLMEAINNE